MVTATEHQEQKALFDWVAAQAGAYPALALLYAIPNGGHRLSAVAGKLKAEGVRKGVSDLCLPAARGRFHGFYGEMKRTDPNARPTDEQLDFLRSVEREGYYGCVAWGWGEMSERLLWYLQLGPFDAGSCQS